MNSRNRNLFVRKKSFFLPFNHLYQACSGPGLCEFLIGTFELPCPQKICTSFKRSGTWKLKLAKLKVEGTPTVVLKKTRFVPGWFFCTNSPSSWTWQKVVDGYNRNILDLPDHHILISRAFATLVRPIVRNTGCDPLFFTTPVAATHCFLQHH